MPLLGALLAWVGPLIARALLALGFSVVTIKGMDLIVGQLREQLISAGNQMGSDLLNLFLLSGGGVAIAIVLGAINTRVAIWTISKATRILGTSSS